MPPFPSERDENFCFPIPDILENERVKIVPFIPSEHATLVFENWRAAPRLIDYLPFGPFETIETFMSEFWEGRLKKNFGDALFVIYDKTRSDENGQPLPAGTIAFINSSAPDLSTEIGCIVVFPQFQRTHITSNAVGLMMHYALDLPEEGGIGCRRLEWRANANNSASVRLAQKMGFVLEGVMKWHRAIPQAKAIGHNGSTIRKGDPRAEHLARDSAILAIYWDIWENGGREQVDQRMARTA
ncbi:hypothetical protein V5O48_002749 [Marasmius crinis-equi]|uniref:N-acetyltransferase domain-containing protein n=1 Tax=Marasmius crinis-equi TaxID=585013 RepID=A0ABR3FUR3_9AGAR